MALSMELAARAADVVDALADLPDPEQFGAVALPTLASLIPADTLVHDSFDPSTGQWDYTDHPRDGMDAAVRPAFVRFLHQHPVIVHHQRTGEGAPRSISDFLSPPRFHRLDLYAECFRNLSIEDQLAITIAPLGGPLVGIAFNRSRRGFSESERQILAVLRRPMAHAWERAARRRRARDVRHAQDAVPPRESLPLTERQRQIIELVAAGRTNAAIGRGLGISTRTVAKHLEHAYRALGVSDRASAAVRVLGHGGGSGTFSGKF